MALTNDKFDSEDSQWEEPTESEKELTSWVTQHIVRWYENTLRPIKGWRTRSSSQMSGSCRGIITWRDNSGNRWIGAGTHSKLYVMNEGGTLKDITPTGFTSGYASSTTLTGYGYSTYGT